VAFVRQKNINGKKYFYLVENQRSADSNSQVGKQLAPEN
jgi:hypothetical protein